MDLVNDRTRSLWAGTNGGHVYVYSITGYEPQSTNSPINGTTPIITDQTSICSMGKKSFVFHVNSIKIYVFC